MNSLLATVNVVTTRNRTNPRRGRSGLLGAPKALEVLVPNLSRGNRGQHPRNSESYSHEEGTSICGANGYRAGEDAQANTTAGRDERDRHASPAPKAEQEQQWEADEQRSSHERQRYAEQTHDRDGREDRPEHRDDKPSQPGQVQGIESRSAQLIPDGASWFTYVHGSTVAGGPARKSVNVVNNRCHSKTPRDLGGGVDLRPEGSTLDGHVAIRQKVDVPPRTRPVGDARAPRRELVAGLGSLR
jgi:hypothetical protein